MNNKHMSKMIAIAVGALFATASFASSNSPAATATTGVKCLGGNSCKGSSECKTATNNNCKGQNTCKGTGFVTVANAAACTALKGTVDTTPAAVQPAAAQ